MGFGHSAAVASPLLGSSFDLGIQNVRAVDAAANMTLLGAHFKQVTAPM